MKLQLKSSKKLRDIQREFHKEFPYLKIEFFKNPHKKGQASAKKDLLDSSLTLGKVAKAQGELDVSAKMKVYELEQQLRRDFGLNVQVFRKAGNVWMETSATDGWTLEEQQAEARESEKQYIHSMHNFADERQ
ncbi:MAG TPA: hypothetical protein VNJ07_13940 [Chitinophagales bacterium]|nr:hypothetical protein [Chitinophagales bacterium]